VACLLRDICTYGTSYSPPISCWMDVHSGLLGRCHCGPHLRKPDCTSRGTYWGYCETLGSFLHDSDWELEDISIHKDGRCEVIKTT
jgi:hypothetical protein